MLCRSIHLHALQVDGWCSGGTAPLRAQVLQKSNSGCFGFGSMVTAGEAGLDLLPGCLVVDPGVTGGAPAGPGFDFVAGGVPEVYFEDFVVQYDALVAGLPASLAAGYQRHAFLEVRFLQLKQRWKFGNPDFYLKLEDFTKIHQDSPTTSGGVSIFCDFRRSMCSTA